MERWSEEPDHRISDGETGKVFESSICISWKDKVSLDRTYSRRQAVKNATEAARVKEHASLSHDNIPT